MILIVTLDDIPPELRHLPIERIVPRQLPDHVQRCMDLATTVLYSTQIKCRADGCRNASGHIMTPVVLSEREAALLGKAVAQPEKFTPASAADLRALMGKRILIRLLGRSEIYETEVVGFSAGDRYVNFVSLVYEPYIGWQHVEDVMALEVVRETNS